MAERVLDSRVAYEGKLLTLKVCRVAVQGRPFTSREIVEHPGSVTIVPFVGDKVMLVKQYRLAAGRVMLELPAGTIKPGESPEECALRELEEETGYKAGKLERMTSLYLAPGYSSEVTHLYFAGNLSHRGQKLESDESMKVDYYTLEEALRMVEKGEINDAKTICGLLFVKEFLRFKAL